jgi:hypothetical protein
MKLKLFFSFLLLSTFIYFYLLSPVHAARQRFRKQNAGPAVASTSRGAKCTVRFRPDRLGLKFTCVTPDDFQSGNYELIYDANGVTQAAGGTILPNNPQTYEVLFGSCSGAVCTFHENIQNARLSIKSTLKNGTRILKPYRLNI